MCAGRADTVTATRTEEPGGMARRLAGDASATNWHGEWSAACELAKQSRVNISLDGADDGGGSAEEQRRRLEGL